MFRNRRPGHVYISLWYFVGAFFWFPWLYASANLMVGSPHIHGVVHAAIAAWYAQGLLGYFFASVGLGAIYYLIPKVIGKPIHSYNLALLGFWSFEIFWGLTGMVRYHRRAVPGMVFLVEHRGADSPADPGGNGGRQHPDDDEAMTRTWFITARRSVSRCTASWRGWSGW